MSGCTVEAQNPFSAALSQLPPFTRLDGERCLDMHFATRKTALLHPLQFMQCEIMLQIPIRDR